MFIITKRLTRRSAVRAVVLLGAILAAIVLLLGAVQRSEPPSVPSAQSNEERIAYLSSLGWAVESEPLETLYLLLPEELSGSEYESYNQLQLTQGFDLSAYTGKQVVRYTYAVTNHPERSDSVQINLYCCDGCVIAGDVIALGEGGFQASLTYPEA